MNPVEIPYRIVMQFDGNSVRAAITDLKDLNGVVVDATNSIASLIKAFGALSAASKASLDVSKGGVSSAASAEDKPQSAKPPAQDEAKKSEDQAWDLWTKGPVGAEHARIDKKFDETKLQINRRADLEYIIAREYDRPTAPIEDQRSVALDRLTIAIAAQKDAATELGKELQKVGQQGVTLLGSGLSKAFGQVIQGTKDAKTAFAEFGASFLQQIAQMIMQALILAAIKSVLAGTKFGEFLFPSAPPPKPSAEGTLTPRLAAAGALNGVQTVSTATWFPAFNTIAGEAGTEVLAVLSRPRLMDMGGLATYVGQVQGHDLAMTDARQLQSAIGNRQSAISPGGRLEIAITLSPEVEARVLRNSVEQAVVEINTALAIDSPTSAAVKSLTA